MIQQNFAVLMPVYNEEKTIKEVIYDLLRYKYQFVIVDDGSVDGTLDIVKSITDEYVTYQNNLGKGYAIRLGAKYLIDKRYDWVIIVDSDGQTPTNQIINLLKLRHIYPKARLIVGDRLNNPSNMPPIRLLINKSMSWLISLLAGQKIADSQCGLKIIHKDVFDLDLKCKGFDFDSEVLLKAGRKGYKIVSGDIDCIYFGNRKSKMHPIKDAFRFLRLIIKVFLNRQTHT